MEIIWLQDARNDLFNYMQNSAIVINGKVEEYINLLVDYVDKLSDSPYLGKVFFYHKEIEIRQLIFRMHRIIYYIKDNEVRILMVTHTARNIENIMEYINVFFH